MDDFLRLINRLGYQFIDQVDLEQGYAFQMTYGSLEDDTIIRFLEEPIVNLPCLIIEVESTQSVEKLVRDEMDVADNDESLAMYANSQNTDPAKKSISFSSSLCS